MIVIVTVMESPVTRLSGCVFVDVLREVYLKRKDPA